MADDADVRRLERTASVLVGRERERALLREEFAAAISGHGQLVLLGGEAGIGKTTLARDLAGNVSKQSACVLTGHCYDLTNTPPYGPWLDLFDDGQLAAGLPVPPAAFAGGKIAAVTDQAALFAEVRRFFAELGAARPTLIVLEDLHWADPASLELLRHVAPHLQHWALLLLVTYRVDELTRRHPLAQQLPALVREAEPLRLDLKRLDADALRALVIARYRLSSPDEDRLVAYLETHAEGNPFFATELLRALEEDALLHSTDDGWSLGELDRVVVPSFLRQVIEGRVARLGEAVRQPLAIAAVIGQEVPLPLWAEVADLGDEALLTIVERAVDVHLLAASRDGAHVRFVHAITREALYEGILPPRRRLWHRRIADALTARPEADPDAVAAHLQRAGDSRAAEWLIRAGDRAQRAYALLTAVERFRAAVTRLVGVPGQERMRALLLYRLARLQRFSTPGAGIDDLDEAERLAQAAGDAVLAAEARYYRGVLRFYADDIVAGLAESESGIAALEAFSEDAVRAVGAVEVWLADALPSRVAATDAGDSPATAPLAVAGIFYRRASNTWIQAASGRLAEAEATGEPFTRGIDPDRTLGSLIGAAAGHAWHGLSVAYAAGGRPDEARLAATRARGYYNALDHHAVIAFSLLMELRDIVIPYHADDPESRRRVAAEAEEALHRAGGALVPGLSPRLAWLACLMLEGRWDEASEIVWELPPPGPCFLRREVTATLATLARHRGDTDLAWETIAGNLPEGPGATPGSKVHQEALFLQRLAADLALDAGDAPAARAWLEAHDRWLAWNGAVLGRAEGRLGWGRYHRLAGDPELAREHADEALVLASEPRQPLALLAAHRLLGEITTSAGDLTNAETHLTAALDLADACEAPFEHVLTRLAIAELCAAQGSDGEAATLVDDVRHVCILLGAAPALARADALATRFFPRQRVEVYPAGLTQREVEVLRLLAQRQTDKEIAETLFLGPRTVQSHVAHILSKLCVANRREAAAEAVRLGLLLRRRSSDSR